MSKWQIDFSKVLQKFHSSRKSNLHDRRSILSLILVSEKKLFVIDLISTKPVLWGETYESHTKTIYSAWNASKTNIKHRDKEEELRRQLSVKNYRLISHNVTTHAVKNWSHTAEAATLAQNQQKAGDTHPLQPRTGWFGEAGPAGCIGSPTTSDFYR